MQNIFTYPITVDDLSSGDKHFVLDAAPAQRDFIKNVLKVNAVKSFHADITLNYSRKENILTVKGAVKTLLTLESVISLELFDQEYKTAFDIMYDTKMTRQEQKELEDTRDNVPDIIIGGKIDLADIAIEQLVLVMDEYPRKKGEQFCFTQEFDPDEPKCENPFKILANLKK